MSIRRGSQQSVIEQTATAGLTLVTTQSFTTSSAVNVNSCFTSTYDNYRVIVNLTAMSATDTSVNLYYRVGGVDTTTDYYRSGYGTDGATVTVVSVADAKAIVSSNTYPTHTAFTADIFRPAVAEVTRAHLTLSYLTNAAVGPYMATSFMRQNTATAFDGFSLVPDSGTISGTAFVYGYGK